MMQMIKPNAKTQKVAYMNLVVDVFLYFFYNGSHNYFKQIIKNDTTIAGTYKTYFQVIK